MMSYLRDLWCPQLFRDVLHPLLLQAGAPALVPHAGDGHAEDPGTPPSSTGGAAGEADTLAVQPQTQSSSCNEQDLKPSRNIQISYQRCVLPPPVQTCQCPGILPSFSCPAWALREYQNSSETFYHSEKCSITRCKYDGAPRLVTDWAGGFIHLLLNSSLSTALDKKF